MPTQTLEVAWPSTGPAVPYNQGTGAARHRKFPFVCGPSLVAAVCSHSDPRHHGTPTRSPTARSCNNMAFALGSSHDRCTNHDTSPHLAGRVWKRNSQTDSFGSCKYSQLCSHHETPPDSCGLDQARQAWRPFMWRDLENQQSQRIPFAFERSLGSRTYCRLSSQTPWSTKPISLATGHCTGVSKTVQRWPGFFPASHCSRFQSSTSLVHGYGLVSDHLGR